MDLNKKTVLLAKLQIDLT